MTLYHQSGNRYDISEKTMNPPLELPPGIYHMRWDTSYKKFFYVKTDMFSLPQKLYGDVTDYTNRVINTFKDRTNNTGVLLVGRKGSGKTLQAKHICNTLVDMGISTIIISEPFSSVDIATELEKIEDPVVVLFDEFEKIFKSNDDFNYSQNGLLTLLDGVYLNKKLYILTANEKIKISSMFMDRPGRVYYYKEYSGINKTAIIDYCNDKLNSKQYISEITDIAYNNGDKFTFDILQSLVEESNRYNENPSKSVEFLNISTSPAERRYRVIDIQCDKGVPVKESYINRIVEIRPDSIYSGVCFRYIVIEDGVSKLRLFDSVAYIPSTTKTDNLIVRCDGVIVELKELSDDDTDLNYTNKIDDGDDDAFFCGLTSDS